MVERPDLLVRQADVGGAGDLLLQELGVAGAELVVERLVVGVGRVVVRVGIVRRRPMIGRRWRVTTVVLGCTGAIRFVAVSGVVTTAVGVRRGIGVDRRWVGVANCRPNV
jgi:hypothetical protein